MDTLVSPPRTCADTLFRLSDPRPPRIHAWKRLRASLWTGISSSSLDSSSTSSSSLTVEGAPLCCTPPAGRGGLAAGELGVPFTQAEDDEEWQEWIDWEDVEKK